MLDVDDNAARHVVANPGIANPGIGRRCECLASTPYSPTASGSTGNSEWSIARI